MRSLALALFALSLLPAATAQDKNSADDPELVAFGLLSQNTGCVIFSEFRKTNAKFWGVAVTTKTTSKLEVVEEQNYHLERKQWDETQSDDLNELQRIAGKDKVKFIKIPSKKPTSEQLNKARAMCKEAS